LRKVRVPVIGSVGASERRALRDAFRDRDREKATAVAMGLFGIEALPPLSPSGRGVPEQPMAVARETGRGRSGSGRGPSRVKQVGGEAGPAEGRRA